MSPAGAPPKGGPVFLNLRNGYTNDLGRIFHLILGSDTLRLLELAFHTFCLLVLVGCC